MAKRFAIIQVVPNGSEVGNIYRLGRTFVGSCVNGDLAKQKADFLNTYLQQPQNIKFKDVTYVVEEYEEESLPIVDHLDG